jgi:hypothetical protein
VKAKDKARPPALRDKAAAAARDRVKTPAYYGPFPQPICLEQCTMNISNGYERSILMTLKAFGDKTAFERKNPHKLKGSGDLWSLDVKSREDKYRLLYFKRDRTYKITNLCTTETH